MSWLLWKDYRLNRPAIIVALFLLIVPYVVIAVSLWRYGIVSPDLLARRAIEAAFFSLVYPQICFALLGGAVIAGERVDRSAEFLAYLPISRRRILASKIILALLLAAVIWLPNLLTLAIVKVEAPHILEDFFRMGLPRSFAITAITAAVFYGVGWLVSSMLESSAIAACVGLVTPFIVAAGLGLAREQLGLERNPLILVSWYFCISSAVAALESRDRHVVLPATRGTMTKANVEAEPAESTSKGSKMSWLLWKDYRLSRPIFGVALFLVTLPHVAVVAKALKDGDGLSGFLANLLGSACFSVALSQICLALLGGYAIAGERVDRSAEFLAYLPIPRGRILASKLILSAALIALIWLPNLLMLVVAAVRPEIVKATDIAPFTFFEFAAIVGLLCFSVAWFVSSMLESPATAACIGLITPLLVLFGAIFVFRECQFRMPDADFPWWYGCICLVLSAVSLTAGTVYYLRRVEP